MEWFNGRVDELVEVWLIEKFDGLISVIQWEVG
jgi:hypothetical protein